MDNPTDDTATVNVKNVRKDAWERGKAAALRSGEQMGPWLSRAIDQLANLEAGERYILPSERANPTPIPPANLPALPGEAGLPRVDFHQVAAVITALNSAGLPIQKRVATRVNTILYESLGGAALPRSRRD